MLRQGRRLPTCSVRHLALPTSRRWHRNAHGKAPDDKGPPHIKLIYPDPPSAQHSNLTAFLAYAKRTGLDGKSTVFVGTHYEYTVAATLSRYGFFLKRIGGASDYGTDLVGTWTLPSLSQPLRVLVQCKAGAQRVGPQHVRELEGAFVGAPVGWRGDGVLGVLVSERAATKGVRDSLGRSRWPMAYACCSRDGAVTQMLWNRRAEEEGLEGYSVAPKHVEGRNDAELVLMRNGEVIG
ncbi:Uncharacterized protein, mitochondrial [Tolypocladium ophioglossoides CBS 100239]|uniref:Uncharacterized protein, mitochondrial n=1 Tax=Tolypocladium ophioglossoides (strain CBS 100239) TaxID=1163406 RepID=A0A0L0N3W8_TOLOC|nr:Uncharacterized protein, mitochondrial [Tolypocladium ophioglossoides CBS 100239]